MKVAIVLIAVGLAEAASAAAVPTEPAALPLRKKCYRDQPGFDACIKSSLMDLIPHLAKGLPEFDFPPIDPYRVNKSLTEYSNGFLELHMTIKDSVTYGLSATEIQNVRTDFSDLNNIQAEVDVFVPRVSSEGKYKVQGSLMNTAINSHGKYHINLVNITLFCFLEGAVEEINGERYLTLKHFDAQPEIGDLKIDGTDLVKGNEALSKVLLRMFNEYWRPVMKEFLPYMRTGWDKGMKEILHRVLHRIPFDELFPLSN